MAKLTDIEQRLQALEARQNMEVGGQITMSNTFRHPRTGAIIPLNVPVATVPSMGQSNVTTPPTITPTITPTTTPPTITPTITPTTTPPTITPTTTPPTITPTTTPEKFYVFDSGTVRSSGTDLTGQSAVAGGPFNTREEAEAFKNQAAKNKAIESIGSAQATTETEIKKPIVERPDLVSPFSDLIRTKGASLTDQDILNAFPDYTDKEIHQYLSTSGLNREGSIAYSAINRYLNSHKVNSETGELEYTGSATRSTTEEEKDTSPMFTVIRREPVGDNQVRVIYQDTNPDSPTFGRFETEIEGATEEERRFDFYVTDSGAIRPSEKGQSPAFIQAVYAGPFATQQEANAAAEAYRASNAFRERNESLPDTGGGTGGTGGTNRNKGEGIEQRFSDVTGEVNYQAGLTGVDPTLRTGEQVVPTQMQALAGEFENTTGTMLAGSQQAATTSITAEQMKNLEVSGYTDPASAHTMDSIEKAQTQVNALALNAAQTNALTGSVTGQTGTLSNQAIADIGPQTQSIDVKKAEGTFEAPNMQGVTASAVPSANLVETDYNVAAAAAKRNIQTEELATAATLGQNVAQAQAAIQADLNNQALTQAAQTTALENAGINAEAVQQQMADVPLEATVQGQLTNLMAQFAGGQTPAFAAAAIRNAEAQMAARGLSASSMAGAAIMQAAMESSIPIAAQDAQIFREINLTNLNNKQQIALANQAAAQNINLANLNNRQQAALSNSTNAFKLQSDSLSNSQQVALANAQLKAAIQGQELTNAQQTALTNAARYAEVNGINLSNEQQTSLANTSANLQVALSNLSNRQQTALANAQIEAAIKGQELTNAQQAALINTQRIAEINNLKFTEEQTRNLNESQIMQSLTLANLDADMKMALQNAATYAGMDMANLNNRQQAQVLNAQSFLQLDLANLTNKQQGEVLKYQTKAQALFSDQAAINAKNQFNAQSENQSDQFFAQLGASVSQQNADRIRGMLEFNVNEANAIEKFNTSVADTRDKFNATMQQQINQSNAQWRRQINTINTAAQNEANRLNALNTLQVSQNRLNQIWQQYRDESTWLQQQQFNRDQYIHELAKINLTGDVNRALFNAETKAGAWQAVGDRLVDWIFDDD